MEAGSPVDDQAKALFGRTIFEIRGAYKHFGGAIALNYADFTLKSGEIHALLGENGAGKSTLLKVLAGVHTLEAGTIALDGKTFIQGSPRMAMLQGVTVIYQEPSLFPDLTLTENVYIGRQLRSKTGINWAEMKSQTKSLFEELGVNLEPSRLARGLSIADQQVVEIAKALSLDARIILMDEPTAALTKSEVNRLMLVMRRLQEKGKSVVFVSHRLDEVFAICDQITVMRDGATVAQAKVSDTSINEVIKWMVGRELKDLFPKMESTIGEVVLEVEGLSSTSEFADITLNVRRGEIVALAGLVGSGRSEVARAIFGIDPYDSGTVKLKGKILPGGKPAVSVESGLALVPEDRRQQGLFMTASVSRNIAMEMLNKLARSGLISQRSEHSLTQEWGKKLQIKYPNPKAPVDQLSGGNQQKTVLAKWFATNPDVLIVDEPTRGIDVQTKAEFHRQLSQAAASGKAILMISSELPEVLGMADRIYVMHEGRLVKELSRQEATQELIMTSATGQGGGA
jgi:rhamnose transport system ATP-binding protein